MPDTKVHLLYVEDDPALVRLVEKASQRRGYSLTHAASVQQALDSLPHVECNMVVLDHNLRGETGLDFLKALETAETRPPVIYVTGSSDATIAVSALKAGAVDYVTKSLDGNFLELLFSAIDSALEKAKLERAKLRAEREMREARERAEMMLFEVNHRIANSLALIASLVRMQATHVKDPNAIAALNETQARITAISGVHRRLYKSTDVGRVALDEYIRDLLEDLNAGVVAHETGSRLQLKADPVFVSTDKAVWIGVAVTELVTNAIKYAYGDKAPGQIYVDLRSEDNNRAKIVVRDEGVGWDGTGLPKGSGLGTRIVKAMMISLQSELIYGMPDKGTEAFFEFDV